MRTPIQSGQSHRCNSNHFPMQGARIKRSSFYLSCQSVCHMTALDIYCSISTISLFHCLSPSRDEDCICHKPNSNADWCCNKATGTRSRLPPPSTSNETEPRRRGAVAPAGAQDASVVARAQEDKGHSLCKHSQQFQNALVTKFADMQTRCRWTRLW